MTGQLELVVDRPTVPGQPLQRPDWLTKDSAWVVLEILAEGPACAEVFWDRLRMNRAAARIHDLTDRYGYEIETRQCQRHHHRGNNVEYILVGVPGVRP